MEAEPIYNKFWPGIAVCFHVIVGKHVEQLASVYKYRSITPLANPVLGDFGIIVDHGMPSLYFTFEMDDIKTLTLTRRGVRTVCLHDEPCGMCLLNIPYPQVSDFTDAREFDNQIDLFRNLVSNTASSTLVQFSGRITQDSFRVKTDSGLSDLIMRQSIIYADIMKERGLVKNYTFHGTDREFPSQMRRYGMDIKTLDVRGKRSYELSSDKRATIWLSYVPDDYHTNPGDNDDYSINLGIGKPPFHYSAHFSRVFWDDVPFPRSKSPYWGVTQDMIEHFSSEITLARFALEAGDQSTEGLVPEALLTRGMCECTFCAALFLKFGLERCLSFFDGHRSIPMMKVDSIESGIEFISTYLPNLIVGGSEVLDIRPYNGGTSSMNVCVIDVDLGDVVNNIPFFQNIYVGITNGVNMVRDYHILSKYLIPVASPYVFYVRKNLEPMLYGTFVENRTSEYDMRYQRQEDIWSTDAEFVISNFALSNDVFDNYENYMSKDTTLAPGIYTMPCRHVAKCVQKGLNGNFPYSGMRVRNDPEDGSRLLLDQTLKNTEITFTDFTVFSDQVKRDRDTGRYAYFPNALTFLTLLNSITKHPSPIDICDPRLLLWRVMLVGSAWEQLIQPLPYAGSSPTLLIKGASSLYRQVYFEKGNRSFTMRWRTSLSVYLDVEWNNDPTESGFNTMFIVTVHGDNGEVIHQFGLDPSGHLSGAWKLNQIRGLCYKSYWDNLVNNIKVSYRYYKSGVKPKFDRIELMIEARGDIERLINIWHSYADYYVIIYLLKTDNVRYNLNYTSLRAFKAIVNALALPGQQEFKVPRSQWWTPYRLPNRYLMFYHEHGVTTVSDKLDPRA